MSYDEFCEVSGIKLAPTENQPSLNEEAVEIPPTDAGLGITDIFDPGRVTSTLMDDHICDEQRFIQREVRRVAMSRISASAAAHSFLDRAKPRNAMEWAALLNTEGGP